MGVVEHGKQREGRGREGNKPRYNVGMRSTAAGREERGVSVQQTAATEAEARVAAKGHKQMTQELSVLRQATT